MRHLITIALLVQLVLPVKVGSAIAAQEPVAPHGQTGNELLRDCTNALRLLDGDLKETNAESVDASLCGGYLTGFYEG